MNIAVKGSSMSSRVLAVLVLVATLALVCSPLATIGFNGFRPEQFPVPQTDPPVQPAGYAFSIWGVIYLWLIFSAIYGIWRAVDDPDWNAMRLPLAGSLIIGTFWLMAASTAPVVATVMIVVMVGLAITATLLAGQCLPWLQAQPVALYAGWLTAASGVSISVVLGGYGILSAQTAAISCLVGVLAIALSLQSARPRLWGYPAAVIWGLIGVIVANLSGPNWPVITLASLGIVAFGVRGAHSKLKVTNR
jgi:hypothetical protein